MSGKCERIFHASSWENREQNGHHLAFSFPITRVVVLVHANLSPDGLTLLSFSRSCENRHFNCFSIPLRRHRQYKEINSQMNSIAGVELDSNLICGHPPPCSVSDYEIAGQC